MDFSTARVFQGVNVPPVVSDIPDQSVEEGNAFSSIGLDNYVTDPDNLGSEITWTYDVEAIIPSLRENPTSAHETYLQPLIDWGEKT
jgi:hypothetical protein